MGLSTRRDAVVIFGIALVLAGLAWLIGFVAALDTSPSGPPIPEDVVPPENFSLYGEVWSHVDREFYGERPAPPTITYEAIEGMVAALDDPYARYLDEDDRTDATARFPAEVVTAIGAWVEPVREGALVVSTLPDSPARQAGLVPGDVILAVDRETVAGTNEGGVVGGLAGDPGTSVELIVRTGEGMPRVLEIVRDELDVPFVSVRYPEPNTAYVRLAAIEPGVVDELDAALEGLQGDDLRAIIVDVRDNPGGDLDAARAVIGRFVDGTAWIETARDGSTTRQAADRSGAPDLALPDTVVVLVNRGTASAAEMLAAALRSHADAVLVGETTFGKGTIQAVQPLSDESLVRLTVREWTTPDGVAIEGEGLEPDVVVEGADAQLDAAVEAAVAALAGAAPAGG